jgi:hypothetical protein
MMKMTRPCLEKCVWIAGLAAWFIVAVNGLKAASPALRVVGSQLRTVAGDCPVVLKGVNVAGLEWSDTGDGPGPSHNDPNDTVNEAFTNWNANFVRLPLCQDRWFVTAPSQRDSGAWYQGMVDTIVNLAYSRGCYVGLDLHWSDAGGWGTYIGQHKLPDDNSAVFWASVAARYANHPAVLFDLYNEPKSVTWAQWRNGGTVSEVAGDNPSIAYNGSYHSPGMQGMLDAVRGAGAGNICIIGGLDWAFDLTGINSNALADSPSSRGLMYAAHIYPWKSTPWDNFVTNPAAGKPVIVSEFGQSNTDPAGWTAGCISWANARGFSYSAWDMHTTACPCVISNWSFTPTSWEGAAVKADLLATTRADCSGPKPFKPGKIEALAVPNPVLLPQVALSVKLETASKGLRVRMYTSDMQLVENNLLDGNYGPGWNSLCFLPRAGLANGFYFCEVTAMEGGPRALLKLCLAR